MTTGRSLDPKPGAAVRERMRRGDFVIHPDHALDEAAMRLRAGGLSVAPVADGDEVVGIVSLEALTASEDRAGAVAAPAVRDRMSATVPFLYDDDPLDLAFAIARVAGHTGFCVVDRQHHLVGLLDLGTQASFCTAGSDVGNIEERIRERTVETASRATASPPGRVPVFSDRPTIRLYGKQSG